MNLLQATSSPASAGLVPAPRRPTLAAHAPWAVPLGAGLAYGLCGWVSQRLELPPGDQSPLQFQAGIALAFVLRWGGWRVLPAVVFVEWLLRSQSQPVGAPVDAVLAACLSGCAAAVLQALLGAALVRRFVRAPLALAEPGDIARFMLLAGFIACALSPIGTAAMGLWQGTPYAVWGVDAVTDWLGQSFGVCVAAPIVLALTGGAALSTARRRATVALPLCLAAALLGAMVLGVRHADRERARASFDREAGNAASIMRLQLLQPLRALEATRDIFTSGNAVSRDGVRLSLTPWLQGPGHLQSIGFSTHVAQADIPAFEARVRADGVPGFKVFDRDDANSLRAIPDGDVFSMTYLEPPSRSASRLGLNALSIQAARRAILETVRTGAPAATRSFRLTQALDAAPQSGVVAYQAVYRGEPRTEAERIALVKGVALTTVRIDESLGEELARLPAGVSACIVDVSAGEPWQRLAGPPGCETQTFIRSQVMALTFAGRHWELRINALRLDGPGERSGTLWAVSFAGLLAAALLAVLLLTVTGRAEGTQAAVDEASGVRAAADRANAAKGAFLADMGHDIRTPMNVILGMSHLALGSGLSRQQHHYIARVEHSAKVLLGLVDDIVDFAKMEAGSLRMAVTAFDLQEVIAAVSEAVGSKAEDKGLKLVVQAPPRLANAVLGDPRRLRQVLVNLLGHAVKSTPRGEVVLGVEEITADLHACNLRFWVRDAGLGLDEAHRRRLVEAFDAVDAGARRFGGSGLGLGLAVCRQLVALMGGRLDLRRSPGQGTEFFFALRFERQASPEREALATSMRLEGIRLLVVDGNRVASRLLLNMAAPIGLLAESAVDGKEAVRAVRRAAQAGHPFDVVLIDTDLPSLDGLACARQVVQAARGACSVVLMTHAAGRGDLLLRVEASDLAVSDLLLKPVTPSRLVDTCLAALGLGDRGVPSVEAGRCNGMLKSLEGVRILLVEDSDINAELAAESLTEAGVRVTLARDGRQALDILEGHPFDAVLLDCQMPVMNGYQTAQAIRARSRWQALPLIAMTDNSMIADRHKALAAGMDDHIAKPINANLMIETLWRWVGDATMRRAAESSIAPPRVADSSTSEAP